MSEAVSKKSGYLSLSTKGEMLASGPVRQIYEAQDSVGESIIWREDDRSLYWIDIGYKRIHQLELYTGRHRLWDTPDFVTSLGMRLDGGFIVGLSREVCLWSPGGRFESFACPEPDILDNRLNEGRVSPDGSFWVGTMQNNLHPDGSPKATDRSSGAIYRISPSGDVKRLTENNIGLSNTMAWTTDNRFLFADTSVNEIYAFDYDPEALELRNRRAIVSGFERGLPDGSCIDADNNLWNCRVVGGSCLANFTTDGELIRVIELPISWPTSCTFGGDDLSTLFVTSARWSMSDDHLAKNPLEGNLFAVKADVQGVPEPRFGAKPA